jgi:hypothetical protein
MAKIKPPEEKLGSVKKRKPIEHLLIIALPHLVSLTEELILER